MPHDPTIIERGKAVHIIAAIFILIGLMQVFAGIKLLYQADALAWSATADILTRTRVLAPLGLAASINLATGFAVYMMRVEAMACLGYLLASRLAFAVGKPLLPLTLPDLSLLLGLTYFTMRLFDRSSTFGAKGRPGWRHPLVLLLLGLAAGHLTVLVGNLRAYPMLVSNGSVSPLLALATLIGCGAFYAAVLMTRSRPERAQKLFLLAVLGMGLSLPAWSYRYPFSSPFWSGALIALFGFGLARRWKAMAGSPKLTSPGNL